MLLLIILLEGRNTRQRSEVSNERQLLECGDASPLSTPNHRRTGQAAQRSTPNASMKKGSLFVTRHSSLSRQRSEIRDLMFEVRCSTLDVRYSIFDVRLATASPSFGGHGEWSALGSRDTDHRARGARVRERDAIESIRPLADLLLLNSNPRARFNDVTIQRFNPFVLPRSNF